MIYNDQCSFSLAISDDTKSYHHFSSLSLFILLEFRWVHRC